MSPGKADIHQAELKKLDDKNQASTINVIIPEVERVIKDEKDEK